MPNIEIHGFVESELKETRGKVVSTLELVLGDRLKEVVITVYQTEVQDLFGERAPFVRVLDSDMNEAMKLARSLVGDGRFDVEVVHITFLEAPKQPK